MASNPMQRKSRISFLLGVIITLLITGVVIAFLLLMLKQKDEELEAERAAKKEVYTLTQDVKAGEVLTQNMFRKKKIQIDSIPAEAISTADEVKSWFLQTKEGESVCRDMWGLYLDRSEEEDTTDAIREVYKNEGNAFFDNNGDKVENGEYFEMVGEYIKKVKSINNAKEDEFGMFLTDSEDKEDKAIRMYQETATGEFYVLKKDTSTLSTADNAPRIKEYIDLKNVPVLAKVDMGANTVITKELVVQSDERITDDTRQEEYNVVILPMDLMTDEYIDIRLMTPNGQNMIVVSKTQVEIPVNADGTYVPNTIKVNLREDEILAMSSAIVEAAGIPGSKLYAVKYVDPAMQEESFTTYVPNSAVTQQLGPILNEDRTTLIGFENPNILEAAQKALLERYSDLAINVRNSHINQQINSIDSQEYKNNIVTGVDESIGNSLTTRKKYLESLNY